MPKLMVVDLYRFMNFLSNEQKGIFYAILSGLLYGFFAYFGLTIIAEGFSKYNMLFWRFLVAAIFMFLVILPKIKKFHYKPLEMFKVYFYGAIFHGPSVIFYFASAAYVGSGIAVVLLFLYPAIVLFLNNLLYKTKISKTYSYAVSLVVIGLILLIDLHHLEFNILGIIFGILTAFSYSCYVVSSKSSKVSSPTFATFLMSLGCASMALISAFITDSFQVPNSANLWFNVIMMGIFCTALPVLCFLKSLAYIDSVKVSILSVSEPLMVMLVGYILLGEKTTLLQFMGAITILSGAIISLNPWKALKSWRGRG